jgi:cell division cycle 2-like
MLTFYSSPPPTVRGRHNSIYLVMDFIEHDLKTLLEDMDEPFLPSEIKTLMQQLVSATQYLHDHWILHRDLKTSNLLMNNRGEIKLADFGMARYTASPPPKLTQLVVTLWYRGPELLLGAETYGPEVDIWSLGCIFGELLTKEPLFQGKTEVDQLSKIFAQLGTPNTKNWPTFRSLPNARALYPILSKTNESQARSLHFPYLTRSGSQLLTSMLSLDPSSRPQASEILQHAYFREDPRPKAREFFPTFPSKAGQEMLRRQRRRRSETPKAPVRGGEAPQIAPEDLARGIFGGREDEEKGGGFALRLG